MKITVTDLGECKKQIDVEVPFEDVQPQIARAYKKYQNRVHIDGFRKGKVPLSMLKKRFGDAINAEVADELLQYYFKAAVNREDLAIVAPGTIKDMQFEEGKPFSFTSEIEVEPEVEVKNYKDLKLEKLAVKVSKNDVEETLKMLQEQKAERREIDGAARQGDLVEGDVQALDATGVMIVGEKWDKRLFELGAPPIGHLIGAQLDGVKKDDVRQFNITVPKEESGAEAERTDYYEITVKSVKEKVLPVLDDDFAKSVGEFETLSALKDNIEARIKDQREEDSERLLKQQMINEIIRRNEFVLPDAMVDNVLDHMWEDFQKQPQSQMPEEQFRSMKRPEVVWNLKWSKIWDAIVKAEALEVTDEELQAEIDKAVNAGGQEDKKLKSWFKDESRRHRLRENLLEDKVIALIKSSSKIKEVSKPKKESRIVSA